RLRVRRTGACPVVVEIVLGDVERTVEAFDVLCHLHVYLVSERSLEETREVEILPVARQVDSRREFRYRGTDVYAVVLVDDSVAVLINEVHVTRLDVVGVSGLRRRSQYLHTVLEDTVHHEHVERAYRITGFGQGDVHAVVHPPSGYAAVD